jgi:aspartate carbamoyltransferase catalytic subunit
MSQSALSAEGAPASTGSVLKAHEYPLEQYEAQLPQIDGDFSGKDIVAISQFNKGDVDIVMEEADKALQIEREDRFVDNLRGKRIGWLFLEDSTRTDYSYRFAALSAGAAAQGPPGKEGLSTSKNETDEDTLETLDQYTHLLVVRHPDERFVPWAALNTVHPVHSGGSGAWEHPTQALLDAFTIKQIRGQLEGQTITMYGDLLKGRTVHSLAQVMAMYGAKINLVAPDVLQMPDEVLDKLEGTDVYQTNDIHEVIGETDILYRVRTQKNRFSPEEFERIAPLVKMVTLDLLDKAPDDMTVLHPRPEDKENLDFCPEVRLDRRYGVVFQTQMGLVVRRALLGLTLDRPLAA